MNAWGKMILDLRIEQGRSQRELAFTAGVPRSMLRRIERGLTNGAVDLIEDLLKALGYDLDAMKVADVGSAEAAILVEERTPDIASDWEDEWRKERLESHRGRYTALS